MKHHSQKHTEVTPTQQLISDLQAAKAEGENGTPMDAMWPAKFYNQKVTVTAPDGRVTQVMPKFCLTDFAASELIAALATRGLACTVLAGGGPPNPGNLVLTNSWSYSETVPWLTVLFDQPYNFNAGEVFDYFDHSIMPKDALNLAEWDIRQQAFLQGLGPAPDALVIMAQTAG